MSTFWRNLRDWEVDCIWELVWKSIITQRDAKGVLDREHSFMDGRFAPVKKGVCVGRTKKGKGTKWMVLADG